MSEKQLEVLLHVGPPKTATTALQDFLAFHKEQLSEIGVYYATMANKSAAHHLPFALLGWNPWILGYSNEQVSIDESLDSLLDEALDKSCPKILISSESFTHLTDEMWSEFARKLEAKLASKPGLQASVRVIYTNREFADRILSEYAERLKHGAKHEFAIADPLIRGQFRASDSRLLNLQRFFTLPVVNQQIEFTDHESSQGFIERWITQVISPRLAGHIASFDFTNSSNQRDSEEIQQKLLEFNRFNSPDSGDDLRPFILLSDFTPELEKGWIRLRLYHQLLIEVARQGSDIGFVKGPNFMQVQIDSLREQNTAYAESLSWRITKPLRWLGKLSKIATENSRFRS